MGCKKNYFRSIVEPTYKPSTGSVQTDVSFSARCRRYGKDVIPSCNTCFQSFELNIS